MNRQQLDLIPDYLLAPRKTSDLLEWLHARGWHLTLADLDAERRLRRPFARPKTTQGKD